MSLPARQSMTPLMKKDSLKESKRKSSKSMKDHGTQGYMNANKKKR